MFLVLLLTLAAQAAPESCPSCVDAGSVCGEVVNDCESNLDTPCSSAVVRRATYRTCAELRSRGAIFVHRGACRDGDEMKAPAACYARSE
jgi:hypothetical protein